MTRQVLIFSALSLSLMCEPFLSMVAGASQDQKQPSQQEANKPSPAPTGLPVYKPPPRGAPGGRVGGGTRGTSVTRGNDQTFTISVLAPDHTGLTSQEQPVLYWYLTKTITAPIGFTLSDDGDKPVLETVLAPPFAPGIHGVQLADFGVHLAPGTPYRWFITFITDPTRRSKDVLAGGTIQRIEMPERLVRQLAEAGLSDLPRLYAETGLWYDAIAAINHLIDSNPEEREYDVQRASLLQQVGLSEIGRGERTKK